MTRTRSSALIRILVAGPLVAWVAWLGSRAGDDVPPIAIRPESGAVEAEPLERQEAPRPEKKPPAPLGEVSGAFTKCTAAWLLKLELTQRTEEVDPGRSSHRHWSEYSSSQGLLERLDRSLADCNPEDQAFAEQIWRLFRTAVDYPELRGAALAKAPLTLTTAARAGELLNGVDPILKNRQLRAVRSPCSTDASCEMELQRRGSLLEEALREVRLLR